MEARHLERKECLYIAVLCRCGRMYERCETAESDRSGGSEWKIKIGVV